MFSCISKPIELCFGLCYLLSSDRFRIRWVRNQHRTAGLSAPRRKSGTGHRCQPYLGLLPFLWAFSWCWCGPLLRCRRLEFVHRSLYDLPCIHFQGKVCRGLVVHPSRYRISKSSSTNLRERHCTLLAWSDTLSSRMPWPHLWSNNWWTEHSGRKKNHLEEKRYHLAAWIRVEPAVVEAPVHFQQRHNRKSIWWSSSACWESSEGLISQGLLLPLWRLPSSFSSSLSNLNLKHRQPPRQSHHQLLFPQALAPKTASWTTLSILSSRWDSQQWLSYQ